MSDPRTAEERLRAAAQDAVAFYDEWNRGDEQREWWNVIDPLRAALAVEPVPLDVERLARAVFRVIGASGPWLGRIDTSVDSALRAQAEAIAREYAALATPPEPKT